jgi:hypothetical protein
MVSLWTMARAQKPGMLMATSTLTLLPESQCFSGHCHPKIIAAIREQTVHYVHLPQILFSTDKATEKLQKIVPSTKPNLTR